MRTETNTRESWEQSGRWVARNDPDSMRNRSAYQRAVLRRRCVPHFTRNLKSTWERCQKMYLDNGGSV